MEQLNPHNHLANSNEDNEKYFNLRSFFYKVNKIKIIYLV